jgi:hypothetical protein
MLPSGSPVPTWSGAEPRRWRGAGGASGLNLADARKDLRGESVRLGALGGRALGARDRRAQTLDAKDLQLPAGLPRCARPVVGPHKHRGGALVRLFTWSIVSR